MDDVLDLSKRIAAAARQRDPVERARSLRALNDGARGILSAAGDAAVYEATRSSTRPVVAERLGVTEKALDKAIRQHRARVEAATIGE